MVGIPSNSPLWVTLLGLSNALMSRMAYADPQRKREAVKEWREANAERVKVYRRKATIKRLLKDKRLPSRQLILRHELTEEELQDIWAAVLSREEVANIVGHSVAQQCHTSSGTHV